MAPAAQQIGLTRPTQLTQTKLKVAEAKNLLLPRPNCWKWLRSPGLQFGRRNWCLHYSCLAAVAWLARPTQAKLEVAEAKNFLRPTPNCCNCLAEAKNWVLQMAPFNRGHQAVARQPSASNHFNIAALAFGGGRGQAWANSWQLLIRPTHPSKLVLVGCQGCSLMQLLQVGAAIMHAWLRALEAILANGPGHQRAARGSHVNVGLLAWLRPITLASGSGHQPSRDSWRKHPGIGSTHHQQNIAAPGTHASFSLMAAAFTTLLQQHTLKQYSFNWFQTWMADAVFGAKFRLLFLAAQICFKPTSCCAHGPWLEIFK